MPGRLRDVVQRLEGNAVGQRRVAENAHHILVAAALVARGAHAECRRQRRAGVSRAIAVMLALSPEGKTIQTVGGADRLKSVFAAGEQFVNVTLMAHVPDKPVFRRRENTMQRDGEFHDSEVRAEMTAVS